jgi:nucleoside-diphosphate-sugar epimerase
VEGNVTRYKLIRMSHLFSFGLGYSALSLAARLGRQGWRVTGTATTPGRCTAIAARGYRAVAFDGTHAGADVRNALAEATHVLISVPPGEASDPVLRWHADDLASAPRVGWIGYLSTVGVYGDWQGEWVDEDSPTRPVSRRSRWRLAAEHAWLAFGRRSGKRVQIFRLAGIYGPGRSAIESLKEGTARRIVKPGQVFNRIHVDDIASVVAAAIAVEGRGEIFNVADDEPAPPQEVVAFAANLLGIAPPPEIPYESAELSPMAASFYGENKRVRNDLIKRDLGVALTYPTYREGLRAIAAL